MLPQDAASRQPVEYGPCRDGAPAPLFRRTVKRYSGVIASDRRATTGLVPSGALESRRRKQRSTRYRNSAFAASVGFSTRFWSVWRTAMGREVFVAIFESRATAEAARRDVETAGIPSDDISIRDKAPMAGTAGDRSPGFMDWLFGSASDEDQSYYGQHVAS